MKSNLDKLIELTADKEMPREEYRARIEALCKKALSEYDENRAKNLIICFCNNL